MRCIPKKVLKTLSESLDEYNLSKIWTSVYKEELSQLNVGGK